ncbi:MAG: helix-turn-helix transcriptional regulator [Gorillibacterium sp.]|nr:helix-turn-helix transcriptional regulator [Gorillibacterium sp.]
MAAESNIKFTCYGKRKAPSYWSFDHFPYVNRLYYIYGGTAFYTSGPVKHQLMPGHLYLFPYGIQFAAIHDPADCLDHLYFDFSVVPPLLLDHFVEYKVEENTVLYHLLKAIECLLSDNGSLEDEGMIKTLFHGLLDATTRELDIKRLSDRRINLVLDVIHEKYNEELTNKSFAELLHMDQRHFIRIFKQALNMTPNKYIREYRLNLAEAMLRDCVPLYEIAAKTGYQSTTSLCHAFKKSRGLSPSAFQEKLHEK